jgi:S1-C subfamily serine protease
VRFQARAINDGGDIITAVDGRPLDDEAALGVALLRLSRATAWCCACTATASGAT